MKFLVYSVIFCLSYSCLDSAVNTTSDSTSSTQNATPDCLSKSFGAGVPDWIANNFDCVQVTRTGGNYTFKTNNIPMHNSAYFPTSDSRYSSSMPSGRNKNPNTISEQGYVFTIPVSPSSSGGVATSGDAIGVATDGVVFYNNEAAAPDTLANEIATLDTANAHPTHTGSYHYHIEPVEISDDDTKLIGVLRDGFPVFGRKCPATNDYPGNNADSLDTYNGHTANTGIVGLGTIYHYHIADIASDDGDGVSEPVVTDTYYGSPGTMVNP